MFIHGFLKALFFNELFYSRQSASEQLSQAILRESAG